MNPRRSPIGGIGFRLPVSLPFLGLLATGMATATAQDALQSVIAEDTSLQLRRQPTGGASERMYWGPVGFNAQIGLRTTYDDNVLFEEDNPSDDFVIAPTFGAEAIWHVSENTSLTLGLGVRYDAYLGQTRPNNISIDPASNSEIAFDFEVGRSLITLYDRFWFTHDYSDRSDVRDHARTYGTFDNTAGARILWAPEPLLLEGGYAFRKTLVTEEEFDQLNRSSHEVFFRIGHIVAQSTRWGVEGTAASTFYDTGERNDFDALSAGPYLEWAITDSINLSLHGGWYWAMFQDNGSLEQPDDISVPYLAAALRHQLTANIFHSLIGSRHVEIGVDSQYVDFVSMRYFIQWEATDSLSLSAGPFYDFGEQPRYPDIEEFDRYGGDLRFMWRMTDQLTSELSYVYYHRESNLTGGSTNYDQNRVSASVSYRF